MHKCPKWVLRKEKRRVNSELCNVLLVSYLWRPSFVQFLDSALSPVTRSGLTLSLPVILFLSVLRRELPFFPVVPLHILWPVMLMRPRYRAVGREDTESLVTEITAGPSHIPSLQTCFYPLTNKHWVIDWPMFPNSVAILSPLIFTQYCLCAHSS